MTNFNNDDDLITPGDARLAADLTELHAAPVPDLRFQRPALPARSERRFGFRVAGITTGVVAIALAAVIVAPGLFGGGTQPVDAAEVLARASEVTQNNAVEGDTSYHLVATSEVLYDGSGFTTEVTFDANDRYATEYRGLDGYAFDQVVNGDDTWIAMSLGGETRAVHGPSSELGIDLTGQSLGGGTSLGDVLAQYTSWGCQIATQQGEDTIAGRSVYVIVVTPDPDNCATPEERVKSESLAGSALTLWVDQETFLTLQTEQKEGDGTVSFRYTVTEIEVGVDHPDSAFIYEAPPGVTIAEATDMSSAKDALSAEPAEPADSAPPESDVEIDKR